MKKKKSTKKCTHAIKIRTRLRVQRKILAITLGNNKRGKFLIINDVEET